MPEMTGYLRDLRKNPDIVPLTWEDERDEEWEQLELPFPEDDQPTHENLK